MRVAAVILAAGESRRFGPENKLLTDVGGVALVCRVADAVLQGGISQIVVVTGHERLSVEGALGGRPLRFHYNSSWARGMGSSIAAGVSALGRDAEGVFIIPGDMPLLSSNLMQKLSDAFEEEKGAMIIVPVTSQGGQRNPVLWPRKCFDDLAALGGAEGAKGLLAKFTNSSRRVTIGDEPLFSDVDTFDDLAAARARVTRDQR